MKRRLATIIASCIVLVISVPSVNAAALAGTSGGNGSEGWTRRTDNIWVGLCVGASLDLTQASAASCAHQANGAAAQSRAQSAQPPNIGAGLCIGASLDLSARSAAQCVRQFPPSATNPSISPSAPGSIAGFSFLSDSPSSGQMSMQPSPSPTPSFQPHSLPPHHHHQRHPAPTMMARYSAMGDSIPAGRGLSQMESGTCSSSDLAYPAKIGSQKGLLVDNLACSGATMLNVAVYQVGQAFAGSSPQLITIQAGANDVKWQDFLRKCYFATCGTEFDTQTASRLLAKLASSTSAALNAIDQQSGGVPPQVRVIGYYNPLPPGCNRLEPRITKSELAWINSETAALNQTLENASRNFSFASFAPLDFSGHELYTSDPWVQNWRDPAPLHPNEEGQQAIAQQVN